MARARFIRPEFFTDEKVGALPFGARLLFEGIWCHSDLRGVFEHSARQLRVLVFPFDEDLTSATVEEWLGQLAAAGMVVRFEADGKAWGFVRHWATYQDISTREVEIGTRRPQPPGWQMPASWAATIERARIAGRLSRESPWVQPRTVLGQTQNPTPPAPPPPTAPAAAAEGGLARAPVDEPGGEASDDGLAGFLQDFDCATVDRRGMDLMPEWRAYTKGLKPKQVREILEAAKPGIRWPSEFKQHRAARANY